MPDGADISIDKSDYYFCFSATLRIFGNIEDLDSITNTLGVTPTHIHRRGEKHRPTFQPYEHDMWSYKAPVHEERPLEEHLDALWQTFQTHISYIKSLKQHLTVDVFCGYRSNCNHAGFEVSYKALVLFTELEVPFGISVII